ncbi:MAG: hypothetical protein ACOYOO_06110 [Saprospiraceae bacterium]
MQEKNRSTLLRSISGLPAHRPPGSLWSGIVAEMDFHDRETALRRSVRRLPEYAPPPQVWARIQSGLVPPARRLLPAQALRWAAAAALLVATSAGIWRFTGGGQAVKVQYTYAAESALTPFVPVAIPEDEAAIESVGDAFSRQQALFQYPDGARLVGELKELNEAGAELRAVLETYGFDEQLALELTKVEIQRNQVIQKMTLRL